jgi:ech hydrogenase subunit D
MNGLADCRTIPPDGLPGEARRLRDDGWRFVTATAVPRPDAWTVLYHFERNERLCHLRVEIGLRDAVPAIDEAYPAAFLVENEMGELQGLRVTGMSVDYGGRLYRDFDGPEGWIHVHAPGSGESVSPVKGGREREP